MDTNTTLASALLIVSTLLLAIVSAAETAIGAMTRARTHNGNGNSLHGLLDAYIQRRQYILRSLNAGVSVSTVITATALILLVAEPRGFSASAVSIAVLLALVLVTAVRQSARTLALVSPEATGVLLAFPIRLLQVVLGPIAWAVAAPARVLVRLFGRDPDADDASPAEELLAVLEQVAGDGTDDSLNEERRMMRGILAMSEQTVREVLSPRIDIRAIPAEGTIADAMKVITETGFSRIPLYEESIDRIIGVVYAKDLLAYLRNGQQQPTLREIARPPYFVPETKRVDDLLADMRRDQVHMAIAVDEYGGTAGVVTVEDLLEEIVGEIVDEYDVEEVDIQQVSADEAIVDARLSIDDLNELFGTEIASEDVDTVGGLVLSLLGRLAVPGDVIESEEQELRFRVLSVLGRRIKKVRVIRTEPAEEVAAV